MRPTLKKVVDAMISDCISGSHVEDAIKHVGAEGGPAEKTAKGYTFKASFFRQRGHPKSYRVTVEEIT